MIAKQTQSLFRKTITRHAAMRAVQKPVQELGCVSTFGCFRQKDEPGACAPYWLPVADNKFSQGIQHACLVRDVRHRRGLASRYYEGITGVQLLRRSHFHRGRATLLEHFNMLLKGALKRKDTHQHHRAECCAVCQAKLSGRVRQRVANWQKLAATRMYNVLRRFANTTRC
jgi:hypothetical protein